MRVGLDIGSTTIKCVVLDEGDNIVYSTYERHFSHIMEKARAILQKVVNEIVSDGKAILAVSGSAGLGLATTGGIPFVQEVFAEKIAAEKYIPNTDCIIELGGEDAKIVFLAKPEEVRMNGSCAGGTGAFIDQMAALLKMTPDEMDKAALKSKTTYTIASRCGVFAKSDIQPLINQGARPEDIASSIYRAVVDQTIAGLAHGRKIEGNILYLGGPLTFSGSLREQFDIALRTHGTCPENSLLFVALGAALYADTVCNLNTVIQSLTDAESSSTYSSLPPLFHNEAEYNAFRQRHAQACVKRMPFGSGPVHIGIDAGSTTIKIAVINEDGDLLFTRYRNNDGDPIPMVKETLLELYAQHPDMVVCSATTTGYGEELMKEAFCCDEGIVETTAHFTAAKHFMPDVDFIIDIGGQDMKCFKIEDGAISDIFLNEACSSGCGSFLQTFAAAMGMSIEEFAKKALYAKHPVDLGSRCTVFMNSSVKQAQKDGANLADISAGLSISIVKNALYKVIRTTSPANLGHHIVVQGGTFNNDAVLRAFELEMGTHVQRPDIAGLMGAYGAALYGKDHCPKDHISSLLTPDKLRSLQRMTIHSQCQGCGNHCQLTINNFTDGHHLISGNRCDRPITGRANDDSLDLYAYKLQSLTAYMKPDSHATRDTIGIPLCLNMYELLPFWHTFWTTLGFRVKVSGISTHETYRKGQATIPSDTACYPAKISHGHIMELATDPDVDAIFYPCMTYNVDEKRGDAHYNCPIVAYYAEVLADNIEELQKTPLLYDYIDISDKHSFRRRAPKLVANHYPDIPTFLIHKAVDRAYAAYEHHMQDIREHGKQIMTEARRQGKHIIVLAGRPYHVDPEINHDIDHLIVKQGAAVVTEDSVADLITPFPTSVLNQWTYHSRLYAAAKYCTTVPDTDLIQLVSFGCGLDAITTDETKEILQEGNKLYTELKIDEIVNQGAVNIRIRSLFAALKDRKEKQ